jgi:hypothetical protein
VKYILLHLHFIVFSSYSGFAQYTPAMPATQTGTTLSNPFGGTTPYSDLRYQYILLASDLTAGGMVVNDVLKSIGFSVSGGSTKTYGGFTIYMKHTNASTISTFDVTGLTLVYPPTNPFINNTAGWKDFSFSNPFIWNGINNILVSICWNNVSTSAGLRTNSSSTGTNRAYVHQATSGTGCNLTGTTVSQNVPRTRFGIQPKITSFTPASVCASSNQTVTITGKYFTGTSAVSIGGTAAASFIVNSDTQITATIGVGTTGTITVTTPQGTGTSTSSISVNTIPNVTASPNIQSICSGVSTGINLTSNVLGTTFSWLTVSNTSVIGESITAQSGASINDNLTNTTTSPVTLNYTVTPTASGCTGTPIMVLITVKPIPSATASPNTQSLCSGSATGISLTSNVSGATFSWLTVSNSGVSGESTSVQISSNINDNLINTTTSSETLNYIVTPTATGCTGTSITVPITVNPYPTATALPDTQTICSGVSTGVSLTSDVAGTTFSWFTDFNGSVIGESTTAQSGSNITDTLTNVTTFPITLNYLVTPTAAGCLGTSIDVPITVKTNPIVTAIPNTQTICSEILPEISFESDLIGTTFSWSTIANSSIGGESSTIQTGLSITDLLTNTTTSPITLNYSVTPLFEGCSGQSISVPITVNPSLATISAEGSTTLCEGYQVLLLANTGSDLTYQWYINSIPISAQNNSILIVDSTGNYNVSVLNNYNCYSNSNTIPVTVNTNPLTQIIFTSSPTTFCQGDSVVLSVSNDPSLSYQWQNNGINILDATSDQLTVYDSGIYSIIATNGYNCSTGSTTQNVTVNPLPGSGISALSNTTFCEGDSVILQGSYIANGTYSWSNQNGIISNSDTSSLVVFDSGSYFYQIVDSNTCSNQSDTIDIIVNSHNPSEIYTTSLGSYSLNGTTYTESGVYIQYLQTINGCDSVLTLNLVIQDLGFDLATSNDHNFLVYPNPVRGNKVFFRKSSSVFVEVIDVTNALGQKIDFKLHDQMIELMPNTKSGIYFIHILSDKRSAFYPVVINE